MRRLLALLLLLSAAPAAATGPAPPPLDFGGPFALVDHDGRPRTDADFRGRFMLVQFGYAFCPDICPLSLVTLAEAMDQLGPLAERVQPLFVTVDPKRDTPDALKDYVEAFHPELIGLTGSEAQVAAAAKAYRVHRRAFRMEGEPDTYYVDHGSLTYLMGPDGAFVTLFPFGSEAAFIADTVRGYVTGS